jgi:hypothetical protein
VAGKAKGVGCLFLLGILGLLALELWLFLVVTEQAEDVFGPLIAVVVLSFIGVRITMTHVKQLPAEFMSGGAGRRFVGVIGGVLIAFPGFGTGALGLILQIGPIQSALGRYGNVVAGSLLRNAMNRMMGGKGFSGAGFPGGGFPGGGFPGGGFPPGGFAGPFPGMQPRSRLKPDERIIDAKPVIDTTIERDDSST